MYDFDDDDANPTKRKILIAFVAVAVIALGWFVVRPKLAGDDTAASPVLLDPAGAPGATDAAPPPDGSGPAGTATSTTSTTLTSVLLESAPPVPSSTVTSAKSSSNPSSASSLAPTTTDGSSYVTLPDGTPQPILVTFDVDTITLSGAVPSLDAAERLATLAQANSKTPAQVLNLLSVDPDVPIGVGVRVVELTSARFPEGSDEVVGDHAKELDRVALIMNAFPNVTLMVVGHADQRGSAETNYRLSEQRAQAVVTYLVSKGVAASRMASRAVGESDLLVYDDDDTALALNRRTEFVFSGILIES
jgi:flagellar motor protein MotB